MRIKTAFITLPVVAAISGFGGYICLKAVRWKVNPLRLVVATVRAQATPPPVTIVSVEFETEYSVPGHTPSDVGHPLHVGEAVATVIFARTSGGSVSKTYKRFPDSGVVKGVAFDERHILDFEHRRRLEVREFLSATQTYPMTDDEVRTGKSRGPTAESNCLLQGNGKPAWAHRRQLGSQTVLGYTTVIIGDDATRQWFVPSLGCAPVQAEFIFRNKEGQTTVKNEQKPVSIVVGEPDASFFQPVGDELSPSDAYRRQIRVMALPESKLTDQAAILDQQDKIYYERNDRK
jgi:hypothetical protein